MGDGSRRSSYLAVDDYGTGGIWFVVAANSAEQIRAALPGVKVWPVDAKPDWMSDEDLAEIALRRTFDIENLPTSAWMDRLRQDRG